jgi:hypothetical protein
MSAGISKTGEESRIFVGSALLASSRVASREPTLNQRVQGSSPCAPTIKSTTYGTTNRAERRQEPLWAIPLAGRRTNPRLRQAGGQRQRRDRPQARRGQRTRRLARLRWLRHRKARLFRNAGRSVPTRRTDVHYPQFGVGGLTIGASSLYRIAAPSTPAEVREVVLEKAASP